MKRHQVATLPNNFFILEDISPFCGATDNPVLDFWFLVSKPEWAALFPLGEGIHVIHSLRFTFGVTPANLLVVSKAAKLFSSMYLWAGIGGARNWHLSCHYCFTVWDQADALPTELCPLGKNQHFTFHVRSLDDPVSLAFPVTLACVEWTTTIQIVISLRKAYYLWC